MDFHFLVMQKSWKINVEKEGAPCTMPYINETVSYRKLIARHRSSKSNGVGIELDVPQNGSARAPLRWGRG